VEIAGQLPPQHDHPTRERVVRSVMVNGPSTAAALAERLELTPAAVRRHLDHLLEDGTLEAREPRVGAVRGRGRPAVQAIRFLAETGGKEAVREFADRRANKIEQRFDMLVRARPDLAPVEALAQVLTDEGYAAAVRNLPVGEQLCQQHCPVSHVANEFPELCEAETAAISRMLGGRHVQRLATIAHGDGVCTTCIPRTTREGSTPANRVTNGKERVTR